MDSNASPKRLRLTSNRSLVLDVLALCDRSAYFPLERSFDLSQIAALRKAATQRISWSLLFLKAYAVVSAVTPQLRQAYVRWPWPHLCEYPNSVGMLAVNREFQGEDRLCWARFISPETIPLAQLQQALDDYQTKPVEEAFRWQLHLSRLPALLRRVIWRANLNVGGRKRPRRIGTFTMSSLAGQSAINRYHPTLATSSLSFGPLDAEGKSLVTLICDHRVFDGIAGARILDDLESALSSIISEELRLLAPHASRPVEQPAEFRQLRSA
jgi:hypothetical protein